MASSSTDKPAASPIKTEPEPELESSTAKSSEILPTNKASPSRGGRGYVLVDATVRILLVVATLVSVVVMVTSDQTKYYPFPFNTRIRVPVKAKFTNSPALIYFIVALSVACLYSIVTTLASFSFISKPSYRSKLTLHFALLDVVVLGLVASATGTAGGIGYIALKGNSHVKWDKVCDAYSTFCLHLGASIAISLFASILLVFLVSLSIYSLHGNIGRL